MLPSDPLFKPSVKTLETDRLSIRIDTVEDYAHAFHTKSDDDLKMHFGITTDALLETQRNKVSGGLTTYRTSVVFLHLIERVSNAVIGSIAFHNWYPGHRRSEIGYAMSGEEHKGKGYMSEAIGPVIAFGFGEMDLNRIEAFIHPHNVPSLKLVERMGFRQEGWLHEHYCADGIMGDSLLFGLLRKEYAKT
jgi:ribosomal-protein-alanine N-acetyltransferase